MIPGIMNSSYRPNSTKPGVAWISGSSTATHTVQKSDNQSCKSRLATADGIKWYIAQGRDIFERNALDPNGSWTTVYTSSGNDVAGLMYGNGYFIALLGGANTSCLVWTGTSISGTPTSVAIPTTGNATNGPGALEYHPTATTNKFVLYGISSNNIAYTSNPLGTWTNVATAASMFGGGVGSVGGSTRYVLCYGNAGLGYSSTADPSGTLTQAFTQPSTASVRASTYANGTWVVGTNAGELITSPWTTAATPAWTVRTSPFTASDIVEFIEYNTSHSMWIAATGGVGTTSITPKIAYSLDNGVTWTAVTIYGTAVAGGGQGFATYNNVFAYVVNPTTTTSVIYYSI
jgi:hypothetical protein